MLLTLQKLLKFRWPVDDWKQVNRVLQKSGWALVEFNSGIYIMHGVFFYSTHVTTINCFIGDQGNV